MKKKDVSEWIRRVVLPPVGYFVIKLVFSTIRMRFDNEQFVFDSIHADKPVIFAFWHNRLAYMAYGYTHRLGKTNLITMISRSKDGRLVGRICELFGLTVAYGSSSRGGTEALREMIKLAKEKNMDCGITPDGPRGPKYQVQPGTVSVAQATGMPIVPICYDVTRKIRLKSWDGFYVPIPFSRGVLMFGQPMYVPATLTDVQRSEFTHELKQRMDDTCKKSKEYIAKLKSGTINM